MILPKFVPFDKEHLWIPENDALYSRDNVLLEGNNAFLFWQSNVKVRSVMLELFSRIKSGEKMKLSKASIASEAKIQYSGLFHPSRKRWFNKDFKRLAELQNTLTKEKVKVVNAVDAQLKEYKQRIKNCHQDKVKLIFEMGLLKEDLKNHERRILTQDRQIERLKNIIENR
jgi:hypothetical protein